MNKYIIEQQYQQFYPRAERERKGLNPFEGFVHTNTSLSSMQSRRLTEKKGPELFLFLSPIFTQVMPTVGFNCVLQPPKT